MNFERLDMPFSNEVYSEDDLPEDVQAALEIYDGVDFEIEEDIIGFERQIVLLEHFDTQTCYVARYDDGEICAVASIDESRTDGVMWVQGIAVQPDLRGEGVGHEFAEFVVDLAKKQGKDRIGSRAVLSALNFHRQEGFVQADDDPHRPLMYKYL